MVCCKARVGCCATSIFRSLALSPLETLEFSPYRNTYMYHAIQHYFLVRVGSSRIALPQILHTGRFTCQYIRIGIAMHNKTLKTRLVRLTDFAACLIPLTFNKDGKANVSRHK